MSYDDTRQMNSRLAAIQSQLARLESASRQRWVYPGGGAAASDAPELVLQVIGGYAISGVDCVRYAASLTPTKVWNPEVDTTGYDAGLGRAWLFSNGQRQTTRVLIRHDMLIHPRALISGAFMRALGTVSLTFEDTAFTAYTFDWSV